MITVQNIVLLCWMIMLAYWAINWWKVKPTKEVKWNASKMRWAVAWGVVLLLLLSHMIFPSFHQASSTVLPQIWQNVGTILVVIGLIIAIIARKVLADNWSSNVDIKKNHKLITTGIYRYMRHPIYTGISLMGFGSILVDQSFLVTLFFVIMIVFLVYKQRQEELLLTKHFPKDYAEYKKRTKALIPFLY
jgi:protein-S-isoprenylcysteine O-methyltransferase Ste14